MAERQPGAVWVESAGRKSGYACVVKLDAKTLRELDLDQALAYAAEVAWVVACAEHDAAVFAQLNKDAAMPMRVVAQVMRQLRNARRPVLEAATAPLVFTPIVSHRDARPLVHVKCGEAEWSWELADVRQHNQHVLEVAVGVQLDALYRQHLRTVVKLTDDEARKMVAMLRPHMEAMQPEAPPEPGG